MSATRPKRSTSTAASASSLTSRRRPPEVLTEIEVLALMKACSARAPTGVRNRALIAVLWRCGLRISEALSLELRDLDLQAGTVRVRHGKGDRSRTVGVDQQTSALLARWLDRRKPLGPGARAPVFCTLQGGRIDTSYVRRLLPRLAAKARCLGPCPSPQTTERRFIGAAPTMATRAAGQPVECRIGSWSRQFRVGEGHDQFARAAAVRSGGPICRHRANSVLPPLPDHLIPELLCGLGHGPKQRAAKGGVDRRVHAHGLRHTHAAELAREGTPINIIRDDLGHTSLAVTDRYLRDVAPQAVIDTLRARRWGDA